jgi:hypothetical protein
MTKPDKASIIKTILILTILGIPNFLYSQSYLTQLHSKLSLTDQKKLIKSDDGFKKGEYTEIEANKLSDSTNNKNQKKYELKRLEADDHYKNAYESRYKVYQSNIAQLRKEHKGDKQLTEFGKKVEESSLESFKKASSLRSQADKKSKISERLLLLFDAEKTEIKYITILQKILYSYFTWPVEYDTNWILSDKTDEPVLKIGAVKDTAHAVRQDMVPLQDTITKTRIQEKQVMPSDSAKRTNISVSPSNDYTTVPPSVPIQRLSLDSIHPKNIPGDTLKPVLVSEKKRVPIKSDDLLVGNDSSLYGKVKVNEEQIDQFNNFLKKKYPSDYAHYVIDFQKLDYSNIDSLQNAWHNYLYYGQIKTDSSKVLIASADSSITDTTEAGKKVIAANSIKNDTKRVKGSQKNKKPQVLGPPPTAESDSGKPINNQEFRSETDTSGFIFRVQIVACRIPVDKKTLSGIYNGAEKIDELKEDGWYKYAIGIYQNYKSARKMRDELSIPGAFVIAYVNGKRIKITPAVAYKRHQKDEYTPETDKQGVTYRVQISASHVPLSDKILKSTYSGNLPIEVLQEDGWYKYSIASGKSYQDAQTLLKTLSIPGAFIVTYSEKNRIDLHKAN